MMLSAGRRHIATRGPLPSTLSTRQLAKRPTLQRSFEPPLDKYQRRSFSLLRRSTSPHSPNQRKAAVSGTLPTPSSSATSRHALHTRPLPARGPVSNFCYRFFAYAGGFILVSGAMVVGFFAYDASTYKELPHHQDVPVSVRALNPRRGGPKNLPIAEVLVDDDECERAVAQKQKQRLVVLGSGWGSVGLLKSLNPDDYHVTVVSPVNYFLFTPMLPSAVVNTLELRSLAEPIRRIVHRIKGHFLKAEAVDVDFSEQLLEVSQIDSKGKRCNFYIPYDKLVIGVGAASNQHGVQGLEYTHPLKTLEDASNIRYAILQNLEQACLPITSDEERRRLLSFVVCGGGPTGVEFAAELSDLLNEDLGRSFPKLLQNEVSVHVIQSRSHILNTYDEALSAYAEKRFAKDDVDILTNSRVKQVFPDKIQFTQRGEDGETITKELPMGFCLWSTGVAQVDFAKRVAEQLSTQTNKRALETDTHLRLNGAPLSTVYAIGDCATVQNNVADHLMTFLRDTAAAKGMDPETMQITFSDWREVAQKVRKRFPQAQDHLRRLDRLFAEYDRDRSGTLDFGELRELLAQIDSKLTSLPATAQRANQQGQYLGRKLSAMARATEGLQTNDVRDGDVDAAVYKAFVYRHMGSLAYIGNAAIFDFNGMNFSGGLLAVYLWRSIYFAQSVSFRTRILLAMDWSKRALFGRDLMNY